MPPHIPGAAATAFPANYPASHALLNLYVAGQSCHLVILRIGYHPAYAINSWFQLESRIYIRPSLEKTGQLRVDDVYSGPLFLGIDQVFFLVENSEDEGHGVEVVLFFLVKMQGLSI